MGGRIIYPKEYGITSYSCLESLVLMMKTSGYRRVDYWHDRFHIKYNLVENIIYSEYYRRLIQKNSIDDIMTLLCEGCSVTENMRGFGFAENGNINQES